MSIAALLPDTPTAFVVADDPARARALRPLLIEAGFAVSGVPGTQTVTVVLASDDTQAQLHAIADAAERHPEIPVLAVMPAAVTGTLLRRALNAGAHGIVLEDRLADTFVVTLRAVAAGQIAGPPGLRRQLARKALSHREKQMLGLVVLGYTNRQIADKLYVAESTVKTHLSSAFAKLDARSRAEAAALILDPEEGYGLGILSIATEKSAGDPR
jgi:DNA-binding NarL/FixJ family response regulator